MEVDEAADIGAVMEGQGTFDVHLHPLVLLNISDQFTRLRAQAEPAARSSIRGKCRPSG